MTTRPPRIIIIGFMAAGKTTVAHALARQLEDSVIDLDDAITTREGRTPQQLIAEAGETAFRAAETRALHAALQSGTARIIALGGGAWTVAHNRALIAQHNCITVWLDAPFELCWQRITNDAAPRPLAPDRAQARARYDERRATYQLAAHHISINAEQSAAEIAREILMRLKPTERILGGLDHGQSTDGR